MNEKPNFIDPSDMPKPKNEGLEQYISKVYESNQGALKKKIELLDLLNTDPFQGDAFRKNIADFEEETRNTKGYNGQQTTIETIRAKNGRQLRIYHYQGSNSVMFGFMDTRQG